MLRQMLIADAKKLNLKPLPKKQARYKATQPLNTKYRDANHPSIENLRLQLVEAVRRNDEVNIELIKEQLMYFAVER